ncbi:MAG: hypothetical protein Q4F79_04585 [Eubacteriales bacterium]|nr:hypothetical protein [Eubacteriales bacterium]
MALEKATRQRVNLRMALTGVSGISVAALIEAKNQGCNDEKRHRAAGQSVSGLAQSKKRREGVI